MSHIDAFPSPYRLADDQHVRLPWEVKERLADAEKDAQARAQAAIRKYIEDSDRLLDAAQRASRRSQKVHWIRRAAQAFNLAHIGQSACQKGCSHCCHTAVVISGTEAKLIGEIIGRKPAAIAATVEPLPINDYTSPCPFLNAGSCSIYLDRPVVCRTHLAMTSDDLFCRLVEGVSVPVPYANAQVVTFNLAWALGPNEVLADMRLWFPNT